MTTAPTRQTLPLTPQDQTPAILLHLSPLLGYLLPSFGHLLGPAVAWLAYRDRSPALDDQGKEVLNFQISLTLYSLIASGLFLLLFALGMLGGLASAVLGMVGATGTEEAAPMFLGLLGTVLGWFGPFAAFFAVFIPFTLLFTLFPLIVMLNGASRVSRGESYRYPLTLRLLR